MGEAAKIVRSTLQLSPNDAQLTTLEQLLSRHPNFKSFTSEVEYTGRWRSWRMDVHSAKESLKTYESISSILGIMSGDESLILSACKDSWRQALVALLIHCRPTARATQVQDVLNKVSHMSDYDTLEDYDKLHVAIMELDVYQIISYASSLDTWLSTHLVDFISACNMLEAPPVAMDIDVREYALLQYGELLIIDAELWSLGADYFGACPTFGRVYLAAYLPRLAISNDSTYSRVMDMCMKYRLTNEMKDVTMVCAMQKMAQGKLAGAAKLFSEAGAEKHVTAVADLLVQKYISQTYSQGIDLPTLSSPNARMMFLERYMHFHSLLSDYQNTREAAQVLIEMITTNVTPAIYWPMLILDALPLLECAEMVLNEDDTFEILRCLEEVMMSHRRPQYLEFLKKNCSLKEGDVLADVFAVVRSSASRNLARAFLETNDKA